MIGSLEIQPTGILVASNRNLRAVRQEIVHTEIPRLGTEETWGIDQHKYGGRLGGRCGGGWGGCEGGGNRGRRRQSRRVSGVGRGGSA